MDAPPRPDASEPPDGTIPPLRRALAQDPDNRALRARLAEAMLRQGRFLEARDQTALLQDGSPAARFLAAWAALGAGDDGVPELLRGLPGEAAQCLDLAPRAGDQGRWDLACELLARAAELEPADPVPALRHAAALEYAARFQEASAALEALEGRFGDQPRVLAGIRFHRATNRLLQGDLREGFRLMEARLALDPPRPMPLARWEGGPLAGRKLILRAEQGYGDLFMFVRYAPLLAARGAEVYLEPYFSAEAVLGTCPGIQGVLQGSLSVPADLLQVELLSLPLLCDTGPGTIPAPVPYLSVPAAVPNREALTRALSGATGRRLGLVWSGAPGHARTRERNLPPEVLDLLGAVPGVTWFSLQKGDLPKPGLPLVDLAPLLSDFADTALALSLLDGLISVDTGIVHLAGAMGVPTWVLLAHLPDWRWGLEGDRTPWYPDLTLWRQEAHWDWPGVLARVAEALTARPGSGGCPLPVR